MALMIFTSTLVNYTMRTNLSVNIVYMVPIPRERNFTIPANGFHGTASHVMIARWAVRCEKGKFVGLLTAGTVGAVVTWSLCGVIISAFGWEWAFYTFGITAMVWCAMAWYLLYDTPQEHPRISSAEKKFIIDGTPDVSQHKAKAPYAQALASVPMWALIIGMFGTGWGSFFVINAVPMFISNVFQFNPAATGLLSSIPYLAKFVTSFGFGFLADFLLKRKLVSLRVLRKSFIIFSHIIPSCMLVIITLTDDATTALTVMAISMAMHGALTVTTGGNAQDLAPNFAGTVFGFVNGGGTIAGILTPLVVAYFTKDNETMFEAWQPVFYVGASVYAVTAIIFILFGSTEIQPWNYIGSGDDDRARRYKDGKV